MPWQPPASAHLHSGPPSASSAWTGPSLATRLRPNLSGLNAFQREQQFSKHYSDASRVPSPPKRSEWDVLRENHRFIRDDEEAGEVSWEERLARAYESKLFKEFALIDLKHYKSRRLALRWRTAPEVVEGIGEDTCGSLRCKWHEPVRVAPGGRAGDFDVGWEDLSDDDNEDRRGRRGSDGQGGRDDASSLERRRKRKRKEKEKDRSETTMPGLRSFELPFVYEEAGERKEALVKVRLCPRCTDKLLWKPEEERAPRATEGRNRDESGREREREAERVERRKDGSHARGHRQQDEKREREREKKRERGAHTETERDERRRRDPERKYEERERGISRSRSPATHDRRDRDKRRDGR